MKTLIFQTDERGALSPDSATIYESVRAQEWYSGKPQYKTIIGGNSDTYEANNPDVTPVGSIEFVNSFLLKSGENPLQPINVPDKLKQFAVRKNFRISSKEFAGNDVDNLCDVRKIISVLEAQAFPTPLDGGKTKLFVKSDECCKDESFETGIYSAKEIADVLNARHGALRLFVSEPIEIVSEWRMFVFASRLRGARPYSGDVFIVPSKCTVDRMIAAWKDAPRAYTLDVGVTDEGRTVIIEAHNFVSCGLYGFDDFSVLPQMIIAGYRDACWQNEVW